ncbi:hypothetical protein F4X33_13220 [Candidatus Poribacteria bacterium]|nr:hypothetical protein [Candidatus Poribacteria bacterium]
MKFIILDDEIVNISQACRVAISETDNECKVYAEYVAGVDNSVKVDGKASTRTFEIILCRDTLEVCKQVITQLGVYLKSDETAISIEQLTESKEGVIRAMENLKGASVALQRDEDNIIA